MDSCFEDYIFKWMSDLIHIGSTHCRHCLSWITMSQSFLELETQLPLLSFLILKCVFFLDGKKRVLFFWICKNIFHDICKA